LPRAQKTTCAPRRSFGGWLSAAPALSPVVADDRGIEMTTVAAVAVCALLGALAAFQVVLASGAPLGRFAWGGQHRALPRRLRISSAVSVAIYALLGVLLLTRADLIRPWAPEWAV
jgi:hypothetical protein